MYKWTNIFTGPVQNIKSNIKNFFSKCCSFLRQCTRKEKVYLTYHHKTVFYQTEIHRTETERWWYFRGVDKIQNVEILGVN